MTNGEKFVEVMRETFGMNISPCFFQNKAYCNMFDCQLKCNECKYDYYWKCQYKQPSEVTIKKLVDNLTNELDDLISNKPKEIKW